MFCDVLCFNIFNMFMSIVPNQVDASPPSSPFVVSLILNIFALSLLSKLFYAPFFPHSCRDPRDKLRVEEQTKTDRRRQTGGPRVEMSDRELHRPVRQSGGRTVGTADRLAVGVSPLTRPDSFHAGSCDGEREDRVRFRPFDVGVPLAFEGTAHFRLCLLFEALLCQALRPSALSGNSQ